MKNTTPQQTLDCPMNPERNDAEAKTVREYLIALLSAGLITGTINGDGYLDDCDNTKGHRLVTEAIRALK